ncbi:hypothetical protein CPB86DRAFT_878824 [Serendipita vermifera]|nr:hypothetical protein CPB86DRAFT_878824 [Serendipita vermifera]
MEGESTGRKSRIALYRFAKDPLQFCMSPFVNKLDALLTFSNVKNINYQGGNPSQAPRGKFPFIILEGTTVPDSELAYSQCIDKGIFQCLDESADLNSKELALSMSIRALVENGLTLFITHERWIDNWYLTRDTLLTDIPALIRPPLAYWLVYRNISTTFWGTGLSRLSFEERRRDTRAYVSALSEFVPQTGYILGKSQPTRVDATVFGFLAALFQNAQPSPFLTQEVRSHPNLVNYWKRVAEEFWPQRELKA